MLMAFPMNSQRRTLVASMLAATTVCCVLACSAGCHARFRNAPLAEFDRSEGYRFDNLELGEGNTDDVFVVLAFSGGGTRAASLAYGVLQGLRDTPLPPMKGSEGPRCLLDEVDMITSVSGGSFTALGYTLWRDDFFDGRFKDRFLNRNVEVDLLLHLLNPLNILSLPFSGVDSIDLASAYYDEKIFERRCYSDMLDRGTRPFVVVNATDISRLQTFEFTQTDFDILGSDLTFLPIGSAAAASSAYPVLLSPLRLYYYAGEPMLRAIEATLDLGSRLYKPRRYAWAQSLLKTPASDPDGRRVIDKENHKYLYVLDGGLSDNLGLGAFIRSFRQGPIRERLERGAISKLVLVIVNAGTEPSTNLERYSRAPGRFMSALLSSSVGIRSTSAAFSGAIHYALTEAEPSARAAYASCENAMQEQCPGATPPHPPLGLQSDAFVVDINFLQTRNDQTRAALMSIITSFSLPTADVDLLVEEGRTQVMKHPEILRLLGELSQKGS